jgi:hypothetical protein
VCSESSARNVSKCFIMRVTAPRDAKCAVPKQERPHGDPG